ncbi:cell division protein CrgA [Mycolicibacterium novocastrense]|nr:cell division protein CrgA [Mycolicibacterium novocastrense]
MPKSKVRKKNDFATNPVSRTPVKVKAGPSSTWFVVLFVSLMLIGLVWLLVFQLASSAIPVPRGARAVELRDRLCLHDHRAVAHHAVALRQPVLN